MQTLDTAFERALTKIIEEQIEAAKDEVIGAVAGGSRAEITVGKILGMRQVLGYFDEVNKQLSER